MAEKHPETHVGLGTLLGAIAAICYTVSILALRYVARPDDADWAIWMSCLKAVPAGVAACVAMAYHTTQGRNPWPSLKTCIVLFGVGLFMQFAGNVSFQIGLGVGGIGLTVPLSFAAMLISAGIAGRLALGEVISRRSLFAMIVLIASIAVLSLGASDATAKIAETSAVDVILLSIFSSCLAGIGWALPGVAIRKAVTGDVLVSASVFFLSNAGVVGLGVLSWSRMGVDGMSNVTADEWQIMAVAGISNAVAFYSVSHALRFISVFRVNLLNATQIGMAAIGGVALFSEQMTVWLVVGLVLTIAGLLLMDHRKTVAEE
ncbi:MAG: hypothetical protein CMJ78_24430 [Planctomycetaceae bacterium]|nr:hypothetical protein [Planctomycetaceae bacterium]